jgi:hypothetical protein
MGRDAGNWRDLSRSRAASRQRWKHQDRKDVNKSRDISRTFWTNTAAGPLEGMPASENTPVKSQTSNISRDTSNSKGVSNRRDASNSRHIRNITDKHKQQGH